MARRNTRPQPAETLEIPSHTRTCPHCGGPLWAANMARRTVTMLRGLVRLRLQVRSCRNGDCPRYKVCVRPEQEGAFALPQHEFGLDIIALVGTLRHAEHRSLPTGAERLSRAGRPIPGGVADRRAPSPLAAPARLQAFHEGLKSVGSASLTRTLLAKAGGWSVVWLPCYPKNAVFESGLFFSSVFSH